MVGPVARATLSPGRGRVKPPVGSRRPPTGRGFGLSAPARKAKVAEEVADRIRVAILDGTFPTGHALPAERALADSFGVSRGSIRDALRRLEAVGLVVTRHGQGTFAQQIDVGRLVAPLASVLSYHSELRDELLDVRRMFEPAVARVAALRVTDEDIAELEDIVAAQRRKLRTGGTSIAEVTAFHHVLARATRNRVVVDIMSTLNELLVDSRKARLKQKGRPQRSILGHEAVLRALKRRDAAGAADAMHVHLDQISARLREASARSRRG